MSRRARNYLIIVFALAAALLALTLDMPAGVDLEGACAKPLLVMAMAIAGIEFLIGGNGDD